MKTRDERLAVNKVALAIDFDAFVEASNAAFEASDLTKFGWPQPSMFSDTYVEVTTKTCRAAGGAPFECDGTEPVSEATMAVAEELAKRFGLDVTWGECEKGWGDFCFTVAK